MHRALALLAVPILLAVTAAGCAGGSGPEPPAGAEVLVLRLTEWPGMVGPGGTAAISPSFSLLGDGRLISRTGPPGGWPQLREDRVPPDGVRQLLRDATAVPDRSVGNVPDAPVVRLVVVSTDGRRDRTLPRTDPAVERLRAALAGYVDGPPVPFRPQAVAMVATPGDAAEPARPWPLPTLAGEPLGGLAAGSTCLVLRGADLDTVRTVATASAGRWRSDGRVWQVAPRPLLPDETGCADL
ncbi:hypothetical protein [Micromonospora costi]|uniref:GerMN domain-containing protein n=1 Tax=Micromonospora costi TaxID=1530042 RepID=A0A3A9ZY75_9ACTN|nr:hypothetical protein [Micromonospora costi]RKN52127.1 hypothetical protein D7193_26590 [Micromonospora costi]